MNSNRYDALTDDGYRFGVEINNQTGMFVNSKYINIVWQFAFKHCEPSFTHITKPCVVVPALCIVVMRNQRNIDTDLAEDI